MRKNFLAPIIFLVALAVTGGYIYVNSAKFIETPTLIMPGDVSGEVLYSNRNILSEIEINTDNFADVINSLSRPSEYSMTVVNTLYAFDSMHSSSAYISVRDDDLKVVTDDAEFLLVDDVLQVNYDGEVKQIDLLDLSTDDIIGIPTYEDVVNLDEIEKVALHTINNEQVIVVTWFDHDLGTTNRFYISLATGILSSYEVVLGDNVLRFVTVKDFKVSQQNDEIFTFN